jgi:hypothetical protein
VERKKRLRVGQRLGVALTLLNLRPHASPSHALAFVLDRPRTQRKVGSGRARRWHVAAALEAAGQSWATKQDIVALACVLLN